MALSSILYSLWYDLREDVLRTYKDMMPERVPLSQQKELKRIKNLVVEEADWLGRQAWSDGQVVIVRRPNTQQQSALLLQSVTRLLHHMSRIFREQMPAPPGGLVTHVDRKLMQKIREKKICFSLWDRVTGHAVDAGTESRHPQGSPLPGQ